jgi:hypothetical protein
VVILDTPLMDLDIVSGGPRAIGASVAAVALALQPPILWACLTHKFSTEDIRLLYGTLLTDSGVTV